MSKKIKKSEVKTELVLEGAEDYERGMSQVRMEVSETRKELERLNEVTKTINRGLRELNEVTYDTSTKSAKKAEESKTEIRIIKKFNVMGNLEEQLESLIIIASNVKNRHPGANVSIEIREPEVR